jgi:hypothetical protein
VDSWRRRQKELAQPTTSHGTRHLEVLWVGRDAWWRSSPPADSCVESIGRTLVRGRLGATASKNR